MQTIKHPYEFLVRWDKTGSLSGAHAQFRYITAGDDGAPIGEFLGPAEPVALAGAAGFPLGDLLTQMQADALTALAAATARVAELEAQLAAMHPATE